MDRLLEIHTPYGRPTGWAEVAMVTDIGDRHELNDDRCLVITSKDLGERATGPLRDFMLCVLADGATGSTFGATSGSVGVGHEPAHAGWRASQLAQAVFVERFLSSDEIDILDRLKDGLRAADRALVDSGEGSLSTTLTVLFLSADGTACAASIGDSVLLVLPPRRKTPGDRRLKKLGYEETTSVGSGDTTLSFVDENDLIEQWWPNKEGGRTSSRVEPGTHLVLMSDGISDNLPAEFIDELLHRHPLDRATVGLPLHTRDRRAQTQRTGGGSTNELGLDNMSAIVVRFVGAHSVGRPVAMPRLEEASLVTLLGTHGGPTSSAGGQFGMACLAGQEYGATVVPGFVRHFLESEHEAGVPERLSTAFLRAMPRGNQAHFAALALDAEGVDHTFSSGWVDINLLPVSVVQRTVSAARDSVLQRFIYAPKLWASSLATLALLLLVSTAFATGTVRPAAPPAPTLAPGEPTPTPDTRPVISFGGFVLVPPAAEATPVPAPVEASTSATPAVLGVTIEPRPTPTQDPPSSSAGPPPPPACRNPFGLLCGSAPPPARRAPARVVPQPASPAQPDAPDESGPPPAPPAEPGPRPSPVPGADSAERTLGLKQLAPPTGSRLDDALHVASLADQNFQRGLTTERRDQP